MRKLLFLCTGVLLIAFAAMFISETHTASLSVAADGNTLECNGGKTKGPDNDSIWDWDEGSTDIPCDPNFYTITGIVATVDSMVRQIAPATSSGSCAIVGGFGGCSSHSRGEIIDGKGMILLTVVDSNHPTYAPVGSTIVIKTTDTKAVFVPEGYQATFVCRLEYEAVAALVTSERFTTGILDSAGTYEFDYCRMKTPVMVTAS